MGMKSRSSAILTSALAYPECTAGSGPGREHSAVAVPLGDAHPLPNAVLEPAALEIATERLHAGALRFRRETLEEGGVSQAGRVGHCFGVDMESVQRPVGEIAVHESLPLDTDESHVEQSILDLGFGEVQAGGRIRPLEEREREGRGET